MLWGLFCDDVGHAIILSTTTIPHQHLGRLPSTKDKTSTAGSTILGLVKTVAYLPTAISRTVS